MCNFVQKMCHFVFNCNEKRQKNKWLKLKKKKKKKVL